MGRGVRVLDVRRDHDELKFWQGSWKPIRL
jgi:hypothetical protein